MKNQEPICLNRTEPPSSQADFRRFIIDTSFSTLGLSDALMRAVAEQGYTEPTPIQVQAIPVVLAGRDLLGAAQTGTGKTAGFTLPMLQRLASGASGSHSPARHPVRALILTPTRELAAQVHESVRTYGKNLSLRAAVIFGGVGAQPQIDALRRGVDIVVATPGRLLDHVEQKVLDLRHVEILVLDEADRMLDMGFIPAIRRILALLPAKRQNLLFSATFPEEIRKLAASFMHDPATVEVARRNTPVELIGQVAHPVDSGRKRELLAHLIKSNDWRQVLVFTRTKHGANRLAEQLARDGIEADAIHGNKSQNARTRALESFKNNELRVLVATDIAARGLDIDALPHVVNYDMPHVAEDYLHRIGRTGRAGAEGEAVSLVSAEDRSLLAAIERLMNRGVEQRIVPGFEPGQGGPAPAAHPQSQPRAHRGQDRSGRPSGRASGQQPAGREDGNRPEQGPRAAERGRRPQPERRPGQGRAQEGRGRPAQAARVPSNRAPGSFPNGARRGPPRNRPNGAPSGAPRNNGQGAPSYGAQRFRTPESFADEERRLQLQEHRRRAKEGGPEFAPPPPVAAPEPKVKAPVQVTTKPRRSLFAALLGRNKSE